MILSSFPLTDLELCMNRLNSIKRALENCDEPSKEDLDWVDAIMEGCELIMKVTDN